MHVEVCGTVVSRTIYQFPDINITHTKTLQLYMCTAITRLHAFKYMHVCVCVSVCAYVCVYMRACTHTHTHTHKHTH